MSKQDKKTSVFLISILLLVFAAISCLAFKPVFANAETDPADFSIRIVHTNDIHARVEESESDGIIGAERLKTIIDTYTADCDLSLVLDSGDLYHGLPIATVSEGGSIAELVNALGYDAMTVGNHDWNYGQDRLKELIEESDLQVLTGNVVCEDGTKFFEEEFLIRTIEKDGRTLKVGLFGLIDPAVYNATDPALLEGLKYTDAAQYANSAARSLREKGCDLVIALTHTMLPSELAAKVEGVDLWLAGHEHMQISTTVETPDSGVTHVYEDGYYLYNIGCYEIDVHMTDSGITSEYQATRYDYAAASVFEKDETISALLVRIKEEQDEILSEKAGYSPEALDGVWEHIRTGETNLGRAVTSAYLMLTGADIAFENAGGIRASVNAGDLTYGDIIAVSPFGNYVVTKMLKGNEILSILEDNIELEIENIAADESGQYDAWPPNSGFYLQVGGMHVAYDREREKGRRILSAYVGDQPLDPDADYTVALNDYLADVDAIPLLVSAPKTGEYIACDQTLISYFSLPAELISTDVNEARIIPTDETDWEFIGFLWNGDEVNGYTAAAAEFVCREDRIHTLFVPAEITEHVTEPTVSDIGKTTYAATAAADVCPDKTMHTESKDAKIKDKISPAAGEDSGSAVKTGDTSNSILWLIILVGAAAIAIASVIVFRMGNKRE